MLRVHRWKKQWRGSVLPYGGYGLLQLRQLLLFTKLLQLPTFRWALVGLDGSCPLFRAIVLS